MKIVKLALWTWLSLVAMALGWIVGVVGAPFSAGYKVGQDKYFAVWDKLKK